jgi:hypothetical protein
MFSQASKVFGGQLVARKRTPRFGMFERMWALAVGLFCEYLVTRAGWTWGQVLYVGLFGFVAPFVAGSVAAKQEQTGVGLACLKCGKRNHDPGGDISEYTCGHCCEGVLERRCFDCGRAY